MIRLAIGILALSFAMAAPVAHSQKRSADIVPASSLKRVHFVQPTWPQSAEPGVEGWVMMTFTVLPDGSVTDVQVVSSHPAGVFDESATTALRQWKFEPVERDDKKVAQRAEIRMTYKQPN